MVDVNNGDELLADIVLELGCIEQRHQRVGIVVACEQGISIRTRLEYFLDGDQTIGARLVLYRHGLTEHLGQLFRHGSKRSVYT